MASRRSKDVERALKLARKATPEAVLYAEKVMRDENEDTRLRLKAAEIFLLHGVRKGDTSKYLGDDAVTSITVHIERHEPISTVPMGKKDDCAKEKMPSFGAPNAAGIFTR